MTTATTTAIEAAKNACRMAWRNFKAADLCRQEKHYEDADYFLAESARALDVAMAFPTVQKARCLINRLRHLRPNARRYEKANRALSAAWTAIQAARAALDRA